MTIVYRAADASSKSDEARVPSRLLVLAAEWRTSGPGQEEAVLRTSRGVPGNNGPVLRIFWPLCPSSGAWGRS